MWSPLLQCTWWLVTNKKAMVEYDLNLQGWLEEVTLFPDEPNDYGFNFNEILSSGKTNNEEDLITCLPDLDWLDAHADLSILDDPKGFDLQVFDIPEDSFALDGADDLLLGFIDNNNVDTSYLSSCDSKDALNDILHGSTQIEQQVASPKSLDFPLPSPFFESTSGASSPAGTSYCTEACPSPSGVSTYSNIDDGGYESISEAGSPSSAVSVSSGLDSSVITVTVCDMDTVSSPIQYDDNTVSIDEITKSVRKRRYVNDGKEIPKVHVSLKNVFHPYAKAVSRRSGGKNERKKIQNKEAAARYRVKKRIEENELSGEVAVLERDQEELRKKHDDLLAEIKYLKKLMREVLEKRGIL